MIEINVGFICSCLLVLPAFLKRHLPPGFGDAIARILPCFGRRTEESTTKTYLSGSTFSHENRSDQSGLSSPDFLEAHHTPAPGATTLITIDNINDLDEAPRKGPLSG